MFERLAIGRVTVGDLTGYAVGGFGPPLSMLLNCWHPVDEAKSKLPAHRFPIGIDPLDIKYLASPPGRSAA